MKKEVFNYLASLSSSNPNFIDSLIVSCFLNYNNIKVKNNKFILNYIITASDKKAYEVFLKLSSIIDLKLTSFNFEDLIELFEFVVSPEDKIITGAVYTPHHIRSFIIENALQAIKRESSPKIADIACGCGSFLFDVAKKVKTKNTSYAIIFRNQLFGLDIQEYSVNRTKILLSLLAISNGEDIAEFKFNIKTGDALNFDWKNVIRNFTGFQIIVGNPPYVCSRSISAETKKHLLKWEVCDTGHPDLYIPFFQIGIESLADNGVLGFITMNTFFKSVNGRALRDYFSSNSYLLKIIDFGSLQIFKARSTYTCICLIEKRISPSVYFYKCTDLGDLTGNINSFFLIPYIQLDAKDGWNLSIHHQLISKIEKTGKPLKDIIKSRNGIATLKNKIYIFVPAESDNDFFYLESDEFLYPIEKAICKDIVNPNMLTNETTLANIMEKIIFPYQYTENGIIPIPESDFRLFYPNAYHYLFTKKDVLATRDKGKGLKYKPWYIYGRNQSLEKLKFKMFFPHITPKIPNYIINSNNNLFFYNGIAIIGENRNELLILMKFLSSRIFWFYVKNTSKPYGDKYYSLSKNYIKNFGIPDLTFEEKKFLLHETDADVLNTFFERKYDVQFA